MMVECDQRKDFEAGPSANLLNIDLEINTMVPNFEARYAAW